MLYFFLSYAREDDPEFVRRFFQDLSARVRDLAGVDRNAVVGFLDEQNVQIGQRWSAELEEALAGCRCFVAMTSPRYFRRDYCGREWYVFDQRLELYRRQHRRHAPALLPILWIPTQAMHPVAREIQYTHAAMTPQSYLDYGLRQMLDLKRFRDDYRRFVFDLARRIVTLADAHDVPSPSSPLRLDHVPNIFADPSAPAGPAAVRPRDQPELDSHRSWRVFVHFIVVAGGRREMSALRRKLDYYGETDVDWAPYRPSPNEALSYLADHVAGERHFDCQIGDIRQLGELLEVASDRNELVVLLVDAWSPGLAAHRRALANYDAHDDGSTAVMIPFNSDDAETLADTIVLQAELARVLPRTIERRDRIMLRQNVPTPDRFAVDLEEILEFGRNRIFKQGMVNPRLPDRPSQLRPILEGPTEGTP